MSSTIQIAEIIISITLILVILIQAKGSGGLGGIFGGAESSGFRTRRGIEQTLFRFTIVLAVIFVAVAAISTRVGL
ncbi:MAG: preprotein translocase subunit SecG [Dehalococcoidia bacterium]|nr:preprotein translocase subunit SecG [Dehalococcoidia bacterium]